MIELLISLFSTVGAAGFGSALKLVAGILQSRHEAKMASEVAKNKNVLEFQKIHASGGQSNASAVTRRVLAVIVMGTCGAMAIYSIMHATEPFVTFVIPEARQGWSLLWGFVRFPVSKEVTVALTIGHLALMYMSIGSMTAGFYFTPNGRK